MPKRSATKIRQVHSLILSHRYTDFKWINPRDIVTAEWVRMKCTFGCGNYGRNACCPPNVPSVEECRRFFDSYATGVLFHFAKKVPRPEARHAYTRGVTRGLLRLERELFLAGYYKVFLLPMDSCSLCATRRGAGAICPGATCPGVREKCRQPALARPSPEAMAVDVFSTARQYGYPIEVLRDYSRAMNRYAFLLIE